MKQWDQIDVFVHNYGDFSALRLALGHRNYRGKVCLFTLLPWEIKGHTHTHIYVNVYIYATNRCIVNLQSMLEIHVVVYVLLRGDETKTLLYKLITVWRHELCGVANHGFWRQTVAIFILQCLFWTSTSNRNNNENNKLNNKLRINIFHKLESLRRNPWLSWCVMIIGLSYCWRTDFRSYARQHCGRLWNYSWCYIFQWSPTIFPTPKGGAILAEKHEVDLLRMFNQLS